MRSGFFTLLFASIVGFGIWFQQAFMGVYSQEFDIQMKANRKQMELIGAKQIEMRDFKKGVHDTSFFADTININNTGDIIANGNIKYLIFKKTKEPQIKYTTTRMLGKISIDNSSPVAIGTNNKIQSLTFPHPVKIKSAQDTINLTDMKYEPPSDTLSSKSPVNWLGTNRNTNANGFEYKIKTGDLSLIGPVHGTFLPNKGDFKSFSNTR